MTLLALLALGGCATTTKTVLGCLPMVNYTLAQQQAVAKDMASHNPPTVEDQFIADYGALRAKNREACGE